MSHIRGSGVPKNHGEESGAPQLTELSKVCGIRGHCLYTFTAVGTEELKVSFSALKGSHQNSFLHQSYQ